MNLLPLLDKGIILSDAAQSKFIHEINFMRSVHMFVLFLHSAGCYGGQGIRGRTLKSFTIRGKVAEKSMT
jgi:hypothetical protein